MKKTPFLISVISGIIIVFASRLTVAEQNILLLAESLKVYDSLFEGQLHVALAPLQDNKKAVYVNQVESHHHHLHMDFWPNGSNIFNENINRSYCDDCGQNDSCKSKHKQ